MSIRLKLFLSHFLVIALPLIVVGFVVKDSIETNYLQDTEAGLISQVDMIARVYERAIQDNRIKVGEIEDNFARVLQDLAAEKMPESANEATRNQVRIIFADDTGKVFFDAEENKRVGEDISKWIDFNKAKREGYGARTTLDPERNAMFMHISVSFNKDGNFAGVASISRSTTPIMKVIHIAKRRLYYFLAYALIFTMIIALLVTHYITSPLKSLSEKARKIASGDRSVNIELPLKDEVGELSRSFSEMTRELEGKNYIEQFASDVSHELRAPLTALKGSTELLLDGACEDTNAREKFLKNILGETERLINLVNGLLTLSKLDSRAKILNVQEFNLSELISRTTDNFTPTANKQNIKIDITCPDNLYVNADESKLEQVFFNLLSNAEKFAGMNGKISIDVNKNSDEIKISISDTGPGIPEHNIPKIFDRFYTTASPGSSHKGTGLGLAIVKRIIEAHNGSIEVKSSENGTIFTILMPV